MRLLIDHRTIYRYQSPASGIVQLLRLTPRSCDTQSILSWRVDVEADGALKSFIDAHGNEAHIFYADGPITELAIHVAGDVMTTATAGILGPLAESLPPGVYLRHTPLTAPDEALSAFARLFRHPDAVEQAHRLMLAVHERLVFDPDVTHAATEAATAFRLGRGVCQDLAQIMIACARLLGVPARYVSGHYAAPDHPEQEAAHAWAELYLPGLGWVAFDPTHGICAGESHVRVAVGLDSADAAPVRGTRRGGGEERLRVVVHGREAMEAPRPAASPAPAMFEQEQRQ